jgi:hypothetical protein
MWLPVFGNAKDSAAAGKSFDQEGFMVYNTRNGTTWDMYQDDHRMYRHSGWYHGYGYGNEIDINNALKPLIAQLKAYDHHRGILEKEGGHISSIDHITGLLTTPVAVKTRYEKAGVPLADQMLMRNVLKDIHPDLKFNVRQLHNRMPVYYICRTRRDYWAEYSLIVEDLYMSPGYPVADDRFMKLMQSGHENYFLRLSQFREKLNTSGLITKENASESIDDHLYEIGRHVFQAAWHEDQRLGFLVAELWKLPEFFQAIELLYLCLSAELCELRAVINENLRIFFKKIYPQPAILKFLEMLTGLQGDMLNMLPLHAARHYRKLSIAFSKYLGTEVCWSAQKLKMPLWKILYGNFSRLEKVAHDLQGDKALNLAGIKLKDESVNIISSIVKHHIK